MKSEKQQGKRRSWGHVLTMLGVFFAIELLSFGDLAEIIPVFAPLLNYFLFSFFHEIHNLLATSVVLFAAYKYGARLGTTAVLVYLAIHIVYFTITSDEWPGNLMEIIHVLLSSFVSFVGIGLIQRLLNSEGKLRASEERYRTLVGNALVGVYRSNLKGDILYVNDASVRMLGFDSAEEMMAGGALAKYKNPSDREILIRELTEKGIVNSLEVELFTKTGEAKNILLSTTSEGDTLSGTMVDITDRKRAEERISHLTDVLKAIRNVNQLIVREKDRERLIRKSCDLLVQRRGYERAWILLLDENKKPGTVTGTGFDENTSTFLKQLETGNYPECLREPLAQEQAVIAYDRPGKRYEWCAGCAQADQHSNEDIFRGRLAREDRLYGIMGVSVPPGTTSDKEERGLFLELCNDISFALASIESENKRKQAEEILRTTEENFQHSVDDSPLGIRIVNAGGETIYVNRALLDIYGFDSLEEFRATPSNKRYTPESYAEYRKRIEKRQRGEFVPSRYEISIVRKDGKVRHLEVIRKEVFWNGKPQFQVLYHDITETKLMQEQLIAQDRLVSIGQLVSGVAHELNNPLTSVLGFSDLLLQRDLPDDIKDDLKIVNDEAKRTSLIVRNLLTFARQQPKERQAIDFNEPIRVVLQLRSHAHRTNNIKVNAHLAPDLPLIMGNGSLLQQVFFNIVTNAEQAMLEAHKKGTLTITTEQKGSFVRASVADDGPGILQEHMTRIFSPFFTTKEVGKGTGLGLSICHGIVTEHGGRIWAESEPGKGATFVVELPVNRPPQEERGK